MQNFFCQAADMRFFTWLIPVKLLNYATINIVELRAASFYPNNPKPAAGNVGEKKDKKEEQLPKTSCRNCFCY